MHCDPHPANVLIREKNGKPQMVLLDHGLYKQLDDDFRIRYALLWRSLMMADVRAIKEACSSLGVDEMVSATFEEKLMPILCIISLVSFII